MRLTKQIRYDAYHNLFRECGKKENPIWEEISEIITPILLAAIPESVKGFAIIQPDYLNFENRVILLYKEKELFDVWLSDKWPVKHDQYRHVLDIDVDTFKKVKVLKIKIERIRNQRAKFLKVVMRIMNRVSSTQALIKALPIMEPHLPLEAQKLPRIPLKQTAKSKQQPRALQADINTALELAEQF